MANKLVNKKYNNESADYYQYTLYLGIDCAEEKTTLINCILKFSTAWVEKLNCRSVFSFTARYVCFQLLIFFYVMFM